MLLQFLSCYSGYLFYRNNLMFCSGTVVRSATATCQLCLISLLRHKPILSWSWPNRCWWKHPLPTLLDPPCQRWTRVDRGRPPSTIAEEQLTFWEDSEPSTTLISGTLLEGLVMREMWPQIRYPFINCSQTKFVAIILVLSVFFYSIFRLTNFSSDAFDFSSSKTG